jgi:hypothetical protein
MPNDDQQVFNEYMKLLALYASAIRDATVIRERNPLAFELASLELGLFSMRRNEENLQPVLDALRKVLDGKLAI